MITALVARFGAAASPEDAVREVGRLLIESGAATAAHVEAVVEREAQQPTGLPATVPFALAHSDAPGALRLAVAVGLFATPIGFRRMDDPATKLPLRVVAVLTVPDRSHQATQLSAVIRTLADPELAAALQARDTAAVERRLSQAGEAVHAQS